jgi:hypothetical protein
MGCVIDHLSRDHRVRVLQDFEDARGARHAAGESAIIRSMDLDWNRQEIAIAWERNGAKETLYFSLNAKAGPRSGHMRDYFAVEEHVPEPRPKPVFVRRAAPPDIPEVAPALVGDQERYDEAVANVWALAARKRFDEAEAQMQLILAPPDPYGGRLQRLAGDMVGIASLHSLDFEDAIYDWARTRAVNLWYAWGSGATSGGEGAARVGEIEDAVAFLAECDAARAK